MLTADSHKKMIWHITKRELYDNLNSLRFALTTALLLGLMLTNAVMHLREHPKRMQKYHDAVTKSVDRLTSHAEDSLYKLTQRGPGKLYKKPSPLHFCAEGGEFLLPDTVEGGHPFGYAEHLRGVWKLKYPDANINMKRVGPDVSKVDWAFVIGYVLSLIALLFTFDGISSEREHGTLRLMFANPIPRHTVLIGKFLGSLISISIPFTLAALVNLLIIVGKPVDNLHLKNCSPQSRSMGTLRYYLSYCAPLHVSVSCLGFVSICARATECSKSGDTPVGLGHLCCFYTEYARINCE